MKRGRGSARSGPIHLGRLDSRGRLSPHALGWFRGNPSGAEARIHYGRLRGAEAPLFHYRCCWLRIFWHGPSRCGRGQHCGDLPGCYRESLPGLRFVGRAHGPLRLLTRAVTYSIVFGVGYGLGLGLWFGLAAGLASGVTVAIELHRAARGLEHYSLGWEGLFSAIRGFAFGAALYRNGMGICRRVCRADYGGAGVWVLARNASGDGLCGTGKPRVSRRMRGES